MVDTSLKTLENQVLSVRQILELPDEESMGKPSLIGGGIQGCEEKAMLYAHPKHHKTNLALWKAFHIASGRTYHQKLEVTSGKVLFIVLEGTIPKLKARLQKMAQNFPDYSWDNLRIVKVNRWDDNKLEQIEGHIKQEKPDLTIIDPFGYLLNKEDKKEDVEWLLQELDRWQANYHIAFLLVHHARKGTRNQN